MSNKSQVTMEFHVSRAARDRYQFDETLFSLSGNVLFANVHAVRVFTQKMNDQRDLVRHPEQTLRAGQVNAMGLIDEILHFVCGLYREQRNPLAMGQAMDFLQERHGQPVLDLALRRFIDRFPPVAVYNNKIDPDTYLKGTTDGVPHRHIVLEEMLMLWLANENPAFAPYIELFDDTALEQESAYQDIIAGLGEFFASQPTFGPDQQNLIDMLRSPAIAVPHSLSGQLAFILAKWGYLLGKYLYRLLMSQDLIREDEKGGMLGAGRALVYQFGGQEFESERFSQDRDWMPRLVLIAKNIYVWLDQLAKKYRRTIRKLDHVPDEELDRLARWGFSGLWLIGLWERSQASRKIKQMCGNPDAVASAYSLDDYHIAPDLGGEEALQNLKDRAWRRGIRLASDMVPNHMGIDSHWVMQHPDWFLALDYCPYPSYSFNGPDLSNDQRVGIFLEDHYYSRSDAAVVFKRLDRWTGSVKYVYHGNDGTSMPWNDTAQLNFLNAELREAVIQTILEVARKFSVIRFDAAMTLARKHIQRLWFPEPGSGGAIPSRSEHGMNREQFLQAIPNEFWREVVDRVAREVPDTLLLAEAFWMMEGFFVRTLGMHRVYNSAFMNMLKNEDNANYRSVMKNTLEFNPEILKRFVNFMNNPDEDTAVAQFGKGDKYFGVCTLMATLPGLPMFGHGQIEGFTEKYGMEYQRAYWDEQVDNDLLHRHEREIFPLLRRRHLFAEVENFFLFDLFTPEGHVNEDVFAYSNRSGEDRALVVYHNKYAATRGWIRTSVGYLGKTGRGDERSMMQRSLGEALGLHYGDDHYSIFRDQITGLEYLRNNRELCDQGLYVELQAFKSHVFLDFRQVRDNDARHYAHLAATLCGRGVPSVDEAIREIYLRPLLVPFRELIHPRIFRALLACLDTGSATAETRHAQVLDDIERRMLQVLQAMKHFGAGSADGASASKEASLARQVRQELHAALHLPALLARYPQLHLNHAALQSARQLQSSGSWACLFSWVLLRSLGLILGEEDAAERSRSWMDEWWLNRIVAEVLRDLGLDESAVHKATRLVGLLISQQHWFQVEADGEEQAPRVLESIFRDREAQQFLGVNRFEEILWFNGELFHELLGWLFEIAVIQSSADPRRQADDVGREIVAHHRIIEDLQLAGTKAGHQVEKLLELVQS